MSEHSFVEKQAYGLAAAQALGFDGSEESWYDAYMKLSECVANDDEPEFCTIWHPFDHMSWNQVLTHIDAEAVSIINAIRTVLESAEKGVMRAAVGDALDLDMTQLNLEQMAEMGSKLIDEKPIK